MKKYKKEFKNRILKENSLSKLSRVTIVQDIVDFIYDNPYPLDDQIHKFAESKDMEANDLEVYIYAILSCFIAGGKSYKSNKKYENFSDDEKNMGSTVEYEHVDEKNENRVVQKISEIISKKIAYDHLVENAKYYSTGKKFNFFDELR
jgi:hypothetical protein